MSDMTDPKTAAPINPYTSISAGLRTFTFVNARRLQVRWSMGHAPRFRCAGGPSEHFTVDTLAHFVALWKAGLIEPVHMSGTNEWVLCRLSTAGAALMDWWTRE